MKLFLSFLLATFHLTDARILGYPNEDGALANINSDLVTRDQNQIVKRKVFHIENQMLSWSDHNLLAKKQGYALASIHSEEDMKVILELTSNDKDYWIGGRRSATQNQVWTWSDGSPWDFTGWYLGEPNHAIEGEDCVEAYHPNLVKQQWVDNPCDQKNMAIYYRPLFLVDSTILTYRAHNARAIAQGYVMASVHSQDDMMDIRDAIALKGLTVETLAWIGLKRKSNNSKTWLWSDGSPLDFTEWDKNEPNNQGLENCVEYREKTGGWNDKNCITPTAAIYMVKATDETSIW